MGLTHIQSLKQTAENLGSRVISSDLHVARSSTGDANFFPTKTFSYKQHKPTALHSRHTVHIHCSRCYWISKSCCARKTKLRWQLTQMAVNKEMLFDKLPNDVRVRCVWRENYWLTAEALSIYRQSAGLFGHEMHSPIMCIGNSIPAIVCRWTAQTSKGIMWRDIGLSDWLFDFDNDEELNAMPAAVLAMAKDLSAAKAKAVKAKQFVQQRQREMVEELRKATSSPV